MDIPLSLKVSISLSRSFVVWNNVYLFGKVNASVFSQFHREN